MNGLIECVMFPRPEDSPPNPCDTRAGDTVREQHPPTAAMVQSQTRGGPTAAQQAEGTRRAAAERLASAQSALEQARSFDRSGQETQCMEAIERAKRLMH